MSKKRRVDFLECFFFLILNWSSRTSLLSIKGSYSYTSIRMFSHKHSNNIFVILHLKGLIRFYSFMLLIFQCCDWSKTFSTKNPMTQMSHIIVLLQTVRNGVSQQCFPSCTCHAAPFYGGILLTLEYLCRLWNVLAVERFCCGTFWLWNVSAVEHFGCGTFRLWNISTVEHFGCGTFRL
ncbi:hypothetical protein ANANG_G00169750, partial [Anguilla anguilla]